LTVELTEKELRHRNRLESKAASVILDERDDDDDE
jgi:hypothetical protein